MTPKEAMPNEGVDVEREVHYILFDVMDLTVLQEKELRQRFTALLERTSAETEAVVTKRERERIDRLEEQLATVADFINEWAREQNAQECHDPYRDLNLRTAISGLRDKIAARILAAYESNDAGEKG